MHNKLYGQCRVSLLFLLAGVLLCSGCSFRSSPELSEESVYTRGSAPEDITAPPSRPVPQPAPAALRSLEELRAAAPAGPGPAATPSGTAAGADLSSAYALLVMKEVQAHWLPPIASDKKLKTQIWLQLDEQGNIQEYAITKSSGNAAFDASAVEAIKKAGKLPAPPAPSIREIIIVFNNSASQ